MIKPKQKQAKQDKVKQSDAQGRRLRDREQLFCREIVIGKSLYEAYLNAGYKANNKVTASNLASRLLKNERIQARLDELREEIKVRYALTEENVFKQCAAILNADARNYTTWGPKGVTLVDSKELTENQALAVEEVSETITKEGGTVKIKFHSKTKALEIGSKLLGMVIERKEHSGPNGGPLKIQEISDSELFNIARRGSSGAPEKAKGKKKPAGLRKSH